MKNLLLIIAVVQITGCLKTDQETKDYNVGKVGNLKQCIVTTEIDGCEYLVGHVPGGDYGWVMTHKGNCNNPIHKNK